VITLFLMKKIFREFHQFFKVISQSNDKGFCLRVVDEMDLFWLVYQGFVYDCELFFGLNLIDILSDFLVDEMEGMKSVFFQNFDQCLHIKREPVLNFLSLKHTNLIEFWADFMTNTADTRKRADKDYIFVSKDFISQ
jgi:hypothetical protein